MEPQALADWLDTLFDRVESVRDMDVSNELREALFEELKRRGFAEEQRGIAEAYIIGGNWRFKPKPYRLEVSDFYPTAGDVAHLQTQHMTMAYFQERVKQLRAEIRHEEEKRARVAFADEAMSKRLAESTRLMVEKTGLLMKAEKRVDELTQQVESLKRERLPLLKIVRAMLEEEAVAINQTARAERSYLMDWAVIPAELSEDDASDLLSEISSRLSLPIETILGDDFGERGVLMLDGCRIEWALGRKELNRLDIATAITTLDGVRQIQRILRNAIPMMVCFYTEIAKNEVISEEFQHSPAESLYINQLQPDQF